MKNVSLILNVNFSSICHFTGGRKAVSITLRSHRSRLSVWLRRPLSTLCVTSHHSALTLCTGRSEHIALPYQRHLLLTSGSPHTQVCLAFSGALFSTPMPIPILSSYFTLGSQPHPGCICRCPGSVQGQYAAGTRAPLHQVVKMLKRFFAAVGSCVHQPLRQALSDGPKILHLRRVSEGSALVL